MNSEYLENCNGNVCLIPLNPALSISSHRFYQSMQWNKKHSEINITYLHKFDIETLEMEKKTLSYVLGRVHLVYICGSMCAMCTDGLEKNFYCFFLHHMCNAPAGPDIVKVKLFLCICNASCIYNIQIWKTERKNDDAHVIHTYMIIIHRTIFMYLQNPDYKMILSSSSANVFVCACKLNEYEGYARCTC